MDNDDLMPSRPANYHWHYAPWLSWLQRPTVKRIVQSEGREFEPHWGRVFTHACANLYIIYCFGSATGPHSPRRQQRA